MNSLTNDRLAVGFTYRSRLLDQFGNLIDEQVVHNIFPTEGMIYLLGAGFGSTSKIATFFCGLFQGNYTPLVTDTAAAFPAAATESTAYAETTRVAFTPNAVTTAQIDNVGLEADFTINASVTIYGAFLASSQAKGSVLGKLISAAKFGTPQIAVAGNVLSLQAGCSLVNV